MTQDTGELAPRLDYPRRWEYRVIGTADEHVRAAIAAAMGPLEHVVRPGNTSRAGRYVSLSVLVTVRDEQHRNALFVALRGHPEVRFVL